MAPIYWRAPTSARKMVGGDTGGGPPKSHLYSILAMYAASIGLVWLDQLLPALVVGFIATVWALWANRRSLFGTALRRVRMKLHTDFDGAVPMDAKPHRHEFEIRPRIWHEKIIEVDIRFTRTKSDKRSAYDPVPGSIIGIDGCSLEPDAPSRRHDAVQSSESGAVVISYPKPIKLDRGRGIVVMLTLSARKEFRGILSFRLQTEDDANMLLARLPVRTTGPGDYEGAA